MDFVRLILSVLSLVIIYKIMSVLYDYYNLRQLYKNIPGVTILPFVDIMLLLARMSIIERTHWYETLIYQFKEGISINWIGIKPYIHVTNPEYLKIIVTSTANVEKSVPYYMLKPWLSNGLITSTGERWFHDRRLIGPTFHFSILENFAATMSERAEILTKNLEEEIKRHQGKPIDFFPFALNVSFDILCETAMGIDIHAQEAGKEYRAMVQRTMKLVMERTIRPWYWPDWIYSFTSMAKEYKIGVHKLHEFTKAVISRKKAARQSLNEYAKPANEETDFEIGKRQKKAFLDLLLDRNETDDCPLTDNELRAQVNTFMFAGHDTTAVAITWTLFCLGSNLEHQEKVHEELEQVFKDSRVPASTKELSRLKYLDRVIKETLRLFPSVPVVSRKLSEDIKLGDYNIVKGTHISLGIVLLHRDPQIWPDPLKFDPNRFLPENSKHRHPYAYIPFSAGSRNCIGQRFALLEKKTVLTAILRRWRVKSLKTPDTVEYGHLFVTRPCEEILIDFTPKE